MNKKRFENPTNFWIFDKDSIDGDVKVRDQCHIIGKYRGSIQRDCNINNTFNQKIPVVFYNLKKFYSHLIIQDLQ